MKLVELECENCGAALKIEEGTNTVNCPYCKASYKIDDEVKHVKYDDMENSGYEFEKGRIKAQKEHASNSSLNVDQKFPKVALIPFVMVAIVMIVILISSAISWKGWNDKFNNNSSSSGISAEEAKRIEEEAKKKEEEEKQKIEEEKKKMEEEEQKRELESQARSFNLGYSSGKLSGFFIKNDLNEVINSNRTNKEKLITVKFNGVETQDSEEILKIIDQLDNNKDYNVLLDYDADGFINVMTIQ